jgi:hypothetical protein
MSHYIPLNPSINPKIPYYIIGNILSMILSHLTQNHVNSTESQPSDGLSYQPSWTNNLTAQKRTYLNKNVPTSSKFKYPETKPQQILNQIEYNVKCLTELVQEVQFKKTPIQSISSVMTDGSVNNTPQFHV